MTDDDVELVARAIADAEGGYFPPSVEQAKAAITTLRAAGWQKVPADCVVVPREPTEKMETAFLRAFTGCEEESFQTAISAGIRAMIEAAKEPHI